MEFEPLYFSPWKSLSSVTRLSSQSRNGSRYTLAHPVRVSSYISRCSSMDRWWIVHNLWADFCIMRKIFIVLPTISYAVCHVDTWYFRLLFLSIFLPIIAACSCPSNFSLMKLICRSLGSSLVEARCPHLRVMRRRQAPTWYLQKLSCCHH